MILISATLSRRGLLLKQEVVYIMLSRKIYIDWNYCNNEFWSSFDDLEDASRIWKSNQELASHENEESHLPEREGIEVYVSARSETETSTGKKTVDQTDNSCM